MKVKLVDLDPVVVKNSSSKEKIINNYTRSKMDYRSGIKQSELEYVSDDLNGTHYHSNYMEYLKICWGNHYGIVMTPDILWHTLISEVVSIVAKNSQNYASLFTTTPDKKQDIVVQSGSASIMPLDVLIDAVEPLVPIDSDLFLPEFTTSTERSRFARYASFADLVSPYYSYAMFLCGIPYVDIRGIQEDYKNILNRWVGIEEILLGQYYTTEVYSYFFKVKELLKRLVSQIESSHFWKDIFWLEKCGSGSQTEIFGWFSDLFYDTPKVRFTHNYSTHLAKVCYKQLNTNKDYEMYHGILCSTLKDDCLEPDFGSVVYEKLKELKIEPLIAY